MQDEMEANLENMEKQSLQAETETRKMVEFLTSLSTKYPGLRVWRIHSSWNFEVPKELSKAFTRELNKWMQENGYEY